MEEDLGETVTVESSDAADVVDINIIDLDDEEIPQLNQSDLDRLKVTIATLLSPSQNE